MKERLLVLIFLASAYTLSAQTNQNTWQSVTDQYLHELMKPGGDDWMYEEEVREQLQAEFKINNDPRLAHLLKVWNIGSLSVEFQKDFASTPYEQALVLMDDYVSNVGIQDYENASNQIQSVLALLESASKDSSVIYIHALMDFGRLHLGNKNYKEALLNYNQASLLTEATVGTGTQLYNDLLVCFSRYYTSIGNIELAVQYNEKIEQHAARELGINLPYTSLFDSHADLLNLADPTVADITRLALLYQYTGSKYYNVYRQALSVHLYAEAARLSKDQESSGPFYAALLWNKGLATLGIDNESTLTDLVEARRMYANFLQQQKISVQERINYFDLMSNLGYAYYVSKNFTAALIVYEELYKALKGTALEQGEWFTSLLHNLILTHQQAGNQKQLTDLLEPYTGDHPTWLKNDSKNQMHKYGDLLYQDKQYTAALRVYTRAYTQYWSEKEFAYQIEQERMSAEDKELMENLIDQRNMVLEIGTADVSYAIHKYKPSGDEYTRLLFNMAHTAFFASEYSLARTYALAYINEFYTQLEQMHENRQRSTDLYEIYRLQEQLYPAYDLFQNILMNDSTDSTGEYAENRMLGYLHLLDAKANIQYQYRHMRQVIESGTDKNLKQAYQTYQQQRDKIALLRLSGNASQDEIDALTISMDTLKQYMSEQTSLIAGPAKSFIFWTDIKQSLKKNEAAVEIRRFYPLGGGIADPVYAVYIITSRSPYPEVVFLKNGNWLEGRGLKRYQNSIQLQQADEESYAVYWKPIHEKLQDARIVYLSADGVYNQINLNTLYNPATRKYLIDELTLYNVVSTKNILKVERKRSQIVKATLMGRPAYYRKDSKKNDASVFDSDLKRSLTSDQVAAGNINDLPGTEVEIATIQSILKKKGVATEYYLGNDATEEQFKNSSADIIHVATHGFWFAETESLPREDAMLNSGLLFAGVKNYYEEGTASSPDDGILTAYEVQGMNLDNTQLVVLSACETGLGKVEVGEGVYGLQRALHIAGVDNIVMSLWKVDDTATQELFTNFYTTWVHGKQPITPSFQKAQLKLKTKYKHPYYWGAFKVIN